MCVRFRREGLHTLECQILFTKPAEHFDGSQSIAGTAYDSIVVTKEPVVSWHSRASAQLASPNPRHGISCRRNNMANAAQNQRLERLPGSSQGPLQSRISRTLRHVSFQQAGHCMGRHERSSSGSDSYGSPRPAFTFCSMAGLHAQQYW